eukprot:TRINITY_DN6644_c0_g1_i1.p1 TRINITY_DN6644_c0_g1~~TRINITY_DN6644_c0_g1_i1.p1  ORF type:complete len:694 (+),score=198.91 TRINITY_DN6644_c0_g1_i1:139-2220(+)
MDGRSVRGQHRHAPSQPNRRRWMLLLPCVLPAPILAVSMWSSGTAPAGHASRFHSKTAVSSLFKGRIPEVAEVVVERSTAVPVPPPVPRQQQRQPVQQPVQQLAQQQPQPLRSCVKWRQTGGCSPNGEREPAKDLPCSARVPAEASGYCECGGGRRVAESGCGHAPFACEQRCRQEEEGRDDAPPPPPPPPGGAEPERWVFGAADEVFEEGRLRFRSTPNGALWSPGQRALKVRETLRRAFEAYRKYAWGCDEVENRGCKMWDRSNHQMATLVDAMSTLWICGLRHEFWAARELVREKWRFTPSGDVGVFETTIRILGGMLSAARLSGDPLLLSKAREVGGALGGAFATGSLAPTGLPFPLWNPSSKRGKYFPWMPGTHSLAEVGSVQLEFRSLARAVGDRTFDEGVTRVMDRLQKEAAGRRGVIPSLCRGGWSGSVSFGAYADSYYEYLLKQWMLTGKQEDRYLSMYKEMQKALLGVLTRTVGNRTFVTTGSSQVGAEVRASGDTTLEHLTCFVGGMLALGSSRVEAGGVDSDALSAAERLGRTCAEMYNTPTGLAPDVAAVSDRGIHAKRRNFPLRPETTETLFYLWRETKDDWYRERSWAIYEGIERHANLGRGEGYSEVLDVFSIPARHSRKMDTFFMAELLKYLFLIQADDGAIDLDCWVFNTEAHPLPVIPPAGAAADAVPARCRKR